jgi:glutamate carboxypeptidase
MFVEGDMRFLSREQLERARDRMRAIVSANLPRTSAAISFTDGMPSMAPTDGNHALLALLDQVSKDVGTGPVVVHDPSKRGAGDISFVATQVSGLDGLGGWGDLDHAPGEWTDLEEMLKLTKRAALLMNRVLWAEPPRR